MNRKIALITGVTGQDGAYLSEFLLAKGYEVHGLKRRASLFNTSRIDHLYQDPHTNHPSFILHYGDMTDSNNLIALIQKIKPDEIYNLAAMSHVKVSFETPLYTGDVDGMGALRILDAVRLLGLEKKTRIYQASTSELYGKVQEIPQNEYTPFYPRSPYAVAKLFAYWSTVNYREAYGLFAANGILFNHESPLRGETFVTRKISRGVARIALGLEDKLWLGNLDSKRDWGHAKDYVRMMWLILQANEAEDWVIATGETTSVREFVRLAFDEVGLTIEFSGKDLDETGVLKSVDEEKYYQALGDLSIFGGSKFDNYHGNIKRIKEKVGDHLVAVDPMYFRPTEVDILLGDASKAKEKLGWEPEYSIHDLVREMVQHDLQIVRKELLILNS